MGRKGSAFWRARGSGHRGDGGGLKPCPQIVDDVTVAPLTGLAPVDTERLAALRAGDERAIAELVDELSPGLLRAGAGVRVHSRRG